MIDRYLLQAFDACKTGNKKNLRSLILNKKVTTETTIPYINIFGVDFINASLLQIACAYGRLNTVDYLLSQDVDINYREGNGHYALHFAALGRHSQIVRKLLDKGANAKCRNFHGYTPLHYGCKLGGTDSIRELINGVERKPDMLTKSRTEYKSRLSMSYSDEEIDLGDNKAEVDARSYADKLTPLHVACENSRLSSAQVLIEYRADINALSKDNWSPLHFASNAKNAQLVNFLIDNGADIHAVTIDGDNAIHLAARNKSKAIVERLILEGVDKSIKNREGETPLILASAAGDINTIKFLLSKGASVHETNNRKQTPLHKAVQYRNVELVKLFLENGADMWAVDIYNNSPLTKARIKEFDEIIDIFKTRFPTSLADRIRLKTAAVIRNKSSLNMIAKKPVTEKLPGSVDTFQTDNTSNKK